MAPSVSTSGCGLGCFGQLVGVAVAAGVVGDLVDPAAPEHPDPGPGEHADGVGMVKAPRDRVAVDLGRPGEAWRELSARVVIALRKRLLQAQRKLTEVCLPERRVTGAAPARQATASGES